MTDDVDPLLTAAADLAELRARARAIIACKYLTAAGRVAMLRTHEAAMLVALRRWRPLAGIVPAHATPNTSRGGRYKTW